MLKLVWFSRLNVETQCLENVPQPGWLHLLCIKVGFIKSCPHYLHPTPKRLVLSKEFLPCWKGTWDSEWCQAFQNAHITPWESHRRLLCLRVDFSYPKAFSETYRLGLSSWEHIVYVFLAFFDVFRWAQLWNRKADPFQWHFLKDVSTMCLSLLQPR